MAFRQRQERRQAAAATILQAHYIGHKTRKEMKDEITKRRLIYLMSKGMTKAALRIQYAWWRHKVRVINRREEAAVTSVALQLQESRDENDAVTTHESLIMARPVDKKARSFPGSLVLGFQKKQMQLDPQARLLSYWKYSENAKAQVKSVPLDSVRGIVQKTGKYFLIVLDLDASEGRSAGQLTFRVYDKETSDVWFRSLQALCENARPVSGPTPPMTPQH